MYNDYKIKYKYRNFEFNTRPFGIEIECSTEYDDVMSIVSNIVPNIKTTTSCNYAKDWSLTVDYSTKSEIGTPIMTMEQKQQLGTLKTICKALKKNNVKTTKADGLHVHVNIDDIEPIKLVLTWAIMENAIAKCVTPIRSKKPTCQRFKTKLKKCFYQPPVGKIISNCLDGIKSKYCALSFDYYYNKKRPTVEFRFHHGTIDYNAIMRWVKLILYMAQAAKTTKLDVLELMTIRYADYDVVNIDQVIGSAGQKIIGQMQHQLVVAHN